MSLPLVFFFSKQKTEYEMRISDGSSDVCSSDLRERNFLPDQLLLQVDFAENFVFNVHQNEIQAQHWSSKMATLFTSMARHLDKHAWDDIDGHIAVGDQLSVRTTLEDGSCWHEHAIAEAFVAPNRWSVRFPYREENVIFRMRNQLAVREEV